jgi:hypothetical protein
LTQYFRPFIDGVNYTDDKLLPGVKVIKVLSQVFIDSMIPVINFLAGKDTGDNLSPVTTQRGDIYIQCQRHRR